MVLTLELTLIFFFIKHKIASKSLLTWTFDSTVFLPTYRILSSFQERSKIRGLKIVRCVYDTLLVTLIAWTLTGYRQLLTLIVGKSLTVIPMTADP